MHRSTRRSAISVLVSFLLAAGVLAGSPAHAAQSAGDGWQNANGTSATATGQASTDAGQPAKVHAFDTDHAVQSCSSPQGMCVPGEPDGGSSFEIFTTTGSATVTFSVTTARPLRCGFAMPYK